MKRFYDLTPEEARAALARDMARLHAEADARAEDKRVRRSIEIFAHTGKQDERAC